MEIDNLDFRNNADEVASIAAQAGTDITMSKKMSKNVELTMLKTNCVETQRGCQSMLKTTTTLKTMSFDLWGELVATETKDVYDNYI